MQTSVLIMLLVILTAILIVLFIFFAKDILKTLNDVSKICRWFISENAGFFKILFIVAFFFEQVIFIYVLNKYFQISRWTSAFIGIFALIVVTTASFQVFVWEYKYYHSQQQLNIVKSAASVTEKWEYLTEKFKEKLKKI